MIVLMTDFGLKDEYVAEMKASIKYIEPSVEIIDLTHYVASGNIKHGQFFLKYSYKFFPKNTIFVAVVDPGVGGKREEIAVRFADRWFIAPDNGILTFAQSGKIFRIVKVKNPLTGEVSGTFHGRDIFAPSAAYLYQGKGEFFEQKNSLDVLSPIYEINSFSDTEKAEIMHIDKFGNIITNISNSLFGKVRITLNGQTVKEYATCFEEGKAKGFDLFIIKGSKGLLEIVSAGQSAAEKVNAKINMKINMGEA